MRTRHVSHAAWLGRRVSYNLNWVTGHGDSIDPGPPGRCCMEQWSSRPSEPDPTAALYYDELLISY